MSQIRNLPVNEVKSFINNREFDSAYSGTLPTRQGIIAQYTAIKEKDSPDIMVFIDTLPIPFADDESVISTDGHFLKDTSKLTPMMNEWLTNYINEITVDKGVRLDSFKADIEAFSDVNGNIVIRKAYDAILLRNKNMLDKHEAIKEFLNNLYNGELIVRTDDNLYFKNIYICDKDEVYVVGF